MNAKQQLIPHAQCWATALVAALGAIFIVGGSVLMLDHGQADPLSTLVSLLFLTPGVAYTVLAFFLHRQERWAAPAAMAVVAFQALSAVGISIVSALYGMMGLAEWLMLAGWVGLLILTMYWLIRARTAPQFQRGFEPVHLHQQKRE
jgi:small-conductance mechanosensitive channel